MSKNIDQIASESYGTEPDPLLKLQSETEDVERQLGESLFDHYERTVLNKSTKKRESTKKHHRRSYRDWQEWMAENTNRHPTLPSEQNIKNWIDHLRKSMGDGAVLDKINHVKKVYEWLQEKPAFKHPTHYNPFLVVKNERELEESDPDDFPKLGLDDIREQVASINHIGERAATVFALKTGVRSTELSNIRFEDLHLTNADVLSHYDGCEGQQHGPMGSHDQLDGFTDVVYIPSDEVRAGNKRKMPTLIPLDDEVRRVLIDWLLIRPDNGDPHVFLTQKGKQMDRNSLRHVWVEKHWTEYQYDDEDEYRSICPHYARHWFSTWFRVHVNMPELWVQYLRGDKTGPELGTGRSAIHRYLHTYYEDVEQEYRDTVFKLGI